ncbi:hypothetical protein U703_02205 [Rhodobacter capsulatus YW1]|nr:hypothetical protein U703_02205 [Rhodobacter capsulatus YW1]
MSKSKTTPAPSVQPYPDRGGSFVLDEGSMTLTPVPKPGETADDTSVQAPVETDVEPGPEPTPEQEPQ